MPDQPIVVLITAPSLEVARQIASTLVEMKLAACANLLPAVRSLYRWQGQVHDDEEVLMVIKTRAELFETHLIPAVRSVHPYEVPEIIALPVILGFQDYLDWMAAGTTPV